MSTLKSKTITNKDDIDYIIGLKRKDLTLSFFMKTFGLFDGKRRFNTYDIITIPAGSYGPEGRKNKNAFITTVGIYIDNKYFIEEDEYLFNLFGYINETMDSGKIKNNNIKLSEALLEEDIPLESLKVYLMRTQTLMPMVSILSPNHTEKLLTCTNVINKKKKELIKKYKKELDAGDEVAATKMEKELLDFAIEYMGDDPGMDSFISGARGNVYNHFKNIFVMKGVIKNSDPNAKQKYNVATSNYIDGISADEYTLFANALTPGPYKRARKTAIGGYMEKLFLYGLQHITLDPAGSDCGTKLYITETLTKKNIDMFMYHYIIEGNKLIELTSKNKDKYIGKTVKLRYSSMCKSKTGICNKCMGNLEYRRGDMNPGIGSTTIPSRLKNISMRSFHDSVEKFTVMDYNKVF